MRKKIIVTGAGSAQSNGVINCLLMGGGDEEILGLGSDPADLMLCRADKKYLMPHSRAKNYKMALMKVIERERPDMIHFQHDAELAVALLFRDEMELLGVRMLVPDYATIDTCVHKYKSWLAFKKAGIAVPENIVLNTREDVERAFRELGGAEGRVWLRSMSIGGGGKGSLAANNVEEALKWIDLRNGWGDFVAAQLLTANTTTWLSLWLEGELIVAQSRRRRGWAHGALSPSGVTGVTRIGETCSDPVVDQIAERAVKAVSKAPNGVYGVDMTYDAKGVPNPTEINIARFFTTVQFFAEAGLNMPRILVDIVLHNHLPNLARKVNPLPDGLLWLRGMDCPPLLTTQEDIEKTLIRVC